MHRLDILQHRSVGHHVDKQPRDDRERCLTCGFLRAWATVRLPTTKRLHHTTHW